MDVEHLVLNPSENLPPVQQQNEGNNNFLKVHHTSPESLHHDPTKQFYCTNTTLETYCCEQCTFKTSFLVNLRRHDCSAKITAKENLHLTALPCKKCTFKTHSQLILFKHVADLCKAANWFKCNCCSFKTGCRRYLTRHQKNKHTAEEDATWFKCEQCCYESRWKGNVKEHVLVKHLDSRRREIIKCNQCSFSTKCRKSLQRHVSSKHCHMTAPKWLKCDLCTFQTLRNDSLKRHLKGVHTAVDEMCWFKCKFCRFKSTRSDNLKRHQENTHLNNKRKILNTTETIRASVLREVKIKPVEELQTEGNSDSKWVKCGLCPFKSTRTDSLKRHMVNQHKSPDKAGWFKCVICSFKTKKKDALKLHHQTIHLNNKQEKSRLKTTKKAKMIKVIPTTKVGSVETTGFVRAEPVQILPKNNECSNFDLCKDCIMKGSLQKPGDKTDTITCMECPFITKCRKCLGVHMLSKHSCVISKKWLKCSVCSFTTLRKESLQRHMLSFHTDKETIQWFECKICKFKSKRKDQLKRHLQDTHSTIRRENKPKNPVVQVQFQTATVLPINGLQPLTIQPLTGFVTNAMGTMQLEAPTTNQPIVPDVTNDLGASTAEAKSLDEQWYSCDLCPFSATMERSLRIHKQTHKNGTSLVYFKCSLCPLKTTRKDSLKRHVRETHTEWSVDEQGVVIQNESASSVQKFDCDECSYNSEWENSLNLHKLLQHEQKGLAAQLTV